MNMAAGLAIGMANAMEAQSRVRELEDIVCDLQAAIEEILEVNADHDPHRPTQKAKILEIGQRALAGKKCGEKQWMDDELKARMPK